MDRELFILKRISKSIILRCLYFCKFMFIKATFVTSQNGMSQLFSLLNMLRCFVFLQKIFESLCGFCFFCWQFHSGECQSGREEEVGWLVRKVVSYLDYRMSCVLTPCELRVQIGNSQLLTLGPAFWCITATVFLNSCGWIQDPSPISFL